LDVLETDLRPIFAANVLSPSDAIAALKKMEPLRFKMNDTPALATYWRKARTTTVEELARQIDAEGRGLSQPQIDAIVRDMLLISPDPNLPIAYGQTLQLLSTLPRYVQGSRTTLKPEHERSIQELARILFESELLPRDPNSLGLCRERALSVFMRFCEREFTIFLDDADVTFGGVCVGERLLEQVPGLEETAFPERLATAHVQRARNRATQGKAAAISLVHLQRSLMLSDKGKEEIDRLKRQCLASVATDLPVSMPISIDGNPTIDPTTLRLLEIACATQILSDTESHWRWRWASPLEGTANVRIYVEAAEYVSTPLTSLSTVSSRYLSHYEDIANPMKAILKSRLEAQESSVSLAKSQYNSAVTSHNIYPTTFSLQNANNAYTRYSMAVDEYNRLVNQYNATPATTTRAVYLPYSFQEGTVKSGWNAIATVSAGQVSFSTGAECIESDFVRYGTKFSDEVAAYRRDDPLTINVGIDAQVERLGKVSSKIRESLGQAIAHMPIDTRADLDQEEGILLAHILHPFGIVGKVAPANRSLQWAVGLCGSIDLPDPNASRPQKILLTAPILQGNAYSAKDIAELYEPFVCEIESPFGQGSGVLISPDGIILTCAHVLLGTDHVATFHKGHMANKYELEVLFVNDKQDVAVARARGLISESWAPVCFSRESVKGERIVSVGNPALADYTISVGAISQGIVSNPMVETATGQERIVCDIMIAQGSSGGPIISLETGYIMGIVTHIAEAGIRPNPEVSTSGWSCLAAPACRLGTWLGLFYDEGTSH